MCDSYNLDESNQCFVCGQPRPAAPEMDWKHSKDEHGTAKTSSKVHEYSFPSKSDDLKKDDRYSARPKRKKPELKKAVHNRKSLMVIGILLLICFVIAIIPKENSENSSFSFPGLINPVESAIKEHEGSSIQFEDVDSDAWYQEAVDYVVNSGLMKGTSETKFEPDSNTTRAMIVTILYRMEGEPAVDQLSDFSDVPDNMWYTNAIAWANANGIVGGYDENHFRPDSNITREQYATIMFRYAILKGFETTKSVDLSGYQDASSISPWAQDAMKWANAEGLINGRTYTTLAPAGNATRAETAAILMRFIERLK